MSNHINLVDFLSLISIVLVFKTLSLFQIQERDETNLFNISEKIFLDEKFETNCLMNQNNEIVKNNKQGMDCDVVPNIVHYVLFAIHEITFGHFISIISVFKNQRPDLIYIHCDCHQLSGDYYQRVLKVANKTNIPIIIRNIKRPTHIFGQKLNKLYLNWHSSDITRIRVLQEFGGIYLDTDVYVVKPLNEFFIYEMTLEWDSKRVILGNQVLISNKNSRFLNLWLQSYRDYKERCYYCNAGRIPVSTILIKKPELVHRANGVFGADGPKVCPLIYKEYYEMWQKDYHTIHFLIRGDKIAHGIKKWCFGNWFKFPAVTKFNEIIIKELPVTFGEMARIVFDFERLMNSK